MENDFTPHRVKKISQRSHLSIPKKSILKKDIPSAFTVSILVTITREKV
jgi:hypothetical protein